MTGWLATVLTIFPEMFPGSLGLSLAGKALADGVWGLEIVDIRGFARDKHRSVDDAPFGGGPGMVMRPDVIDAAIAGAGGCGPLVYLSPRGRLLDQARVRALAAGPGVRLLCGRFEGVDERVLAARDIEEISLGDFVLSGGEPAAIALLDACVRMLPGVVGAAESLTEESFERGLLEYPHYTRPQECRDQLQFRPAQDLVWRGRRARLPALLAAHHDDRGGAPRQGAARQALLPARADRQGGTHPRAGARHRAGGSGSRRCGAGGRHGEVVGFHTIRRAGLGRAPLEWGEVT